MDQQKESQNKKIEMEQFKLKECDLLKGKRKTAYLLVCIKKNIRKLLHKIFENYGWRSI
jgi:hypothetical protein